jgi:hypothetical protein
MNKLNENLIQTKYKYSHGEINTPFRLVREMLSLFPDEFLSNPNNRWLDPGCGQGNISWILYETLMAHLADAGISSLEDHILTNMLYMVEINEAREIDIRNRFPHSLPNLSMGNYIDYSPEDTTTGNLIQFDAIICNPPFNFAGSIKTPTNKVNNKKDDGFSAWEVFVRHSLNMLRPDGYMCFIIPTIWLKPDKAGMYDFLLKWDIVKMHVLSTAETNSIFKGQAQTPTTFFLLRKREITQQKIEMFCYKEQCYFNYQVFKNRPIPMCNPMLINKLMYYVNSAGHINVIKTNMPPKNADFSPFPTKRHRYKNIKTVLASKKTHGSNIFKVNNKYYGERVVNWSDIPCVGYGTPKIIMAHKMYGMPFLDISGEYGISNRDNYIITDYSTEALQRITDYLSLDFIQKVFDTTRYRMRYLERYAFEFIPDITHLSDFPMDNITNKTIEKYFCINC